MPKKSDPFFDPPAVGDKEATPPPVDPRLDKIENTLAQLTDVLSHLVKNLPEKKEEVPKKPMTPMQQETMKKEVESLLLPPSWRAIVDEFLGVDFQTTLQESAGGNFSMLVQFPPHIDRRVGTQRDINKMDETMFSPIRLASPLDDVRRWCELTVQNIKLSPGLNKFSPKQKV